MGSLLGVVRRRMERLDSPREGGIWREISPGSRSRMESIQRKDR